MKKTNAVRILESKNIPFDIAEYEVDENNLDAVHVAHAINAEEEVVFKTLLARGDGKEVLVFCIPGNMELDLKKAAKASGHKKVELTKVKELLPLTGYIRGGCSPIGMKKNYPTFVEESALLFDEIYVSAGVRGMQLKISPQDLAELTEATFADLV